MLKTYRIIPLVFILFLFEILVLCSVPGNDVVAQSADSVAGLRQELKELSAQIQLLLQKQDSLKTRLDSLENQPLANPPITPAPPTPPIPLHALSYPTTSPGSEYELGMHNKHKLLFVGTENVMYKKFSE